MQSPALSPTAKFTLLTCLYFSQGLPYGFFSQVLPVIMREDKASLPEIGLTSLLALPWMLKFLWAPLVDRYGSQRHGAKRVWILALQALAVLLFLVLAGFGELAGIRLIAVGYLIASLIAATQDIATDGLAVNLLSADQRGIGNGLQVAGYRLGMIFGGGAMLVILAMSTRSLTFLAMAGVLTVASLPILRYREPRRQVAEEDRPTLAAALHFVRRPGILLFLFAIGFFKFGDAMTTQMLRPFLVDAGFDKTAIGSFNALGSAGGLIGALIGGWSVRYWGRYRAIVTFGAIQTLGVLAYAAICAHWLPTDWVFPIGIVEHLTGGMATAALFTAMMDVCEETTASTDYTVQASVVVITTGAAQALSGFTAERFGYQGNYLLSAGLCLMGALSFALIYAHQARQRGAFQLFPSA